MARRWRGNLAAGWPAPASRSTRGLPSASSAPPNAAPSTPAGSPAALRAGAEALAARRAAAAGLRIKLAAERDGILSHLSDVLPLNASEIARKLQLPIAEVIGRLPSLELEGAVKRHQGGYVRALR